MPDNIAFVISLLLSRRLFDRHVIPQHTQKPKEPTIATIKLFVRTVIRDIMSDDLGLLTIKVVASSITQKLQAIEQIKETWDTDETEFAQYRLEVGLQIEYAVHTSEELETCTEQLLNSPPAYNNNPNEQRHRHIELHVLSDQLFSYSSMLLSKIRGLKEQVNESMELRVEEAAARAKQVVLEVQNIVSAVEKLKVEEGT